MSCFEPTPGGGDAEDRPDGAGTGWTAPDLEPLSESVTITLEAGSFSLFGGELVVTVAAGTVTQPLQITVLRDLVAVRGTDTIGYVWGPYTRFTPSVRLRVSLPASMLPAGAAGRSDLGLYALEGTTTTALANPEVSIGDPIVLEADLGESATVVVWSEAFAQ
jgi:hypothetical protein